jgi:hypothetical protein
VDRDPPEQFEMVPVRDICAFLLTVLLVGAVLGTGYVMRESHYSARDMTDMSSRRHVSW